MSAKDKFHEAVKNALQKEQWLITHDPLHLDFADVEMYIDLGAEKLIAAQRDQEKIAVEIKSFLRVSAISEFHIAVGQFINYRLALSQTNPEHILYLAVPSDTYNSFFLLRFPQLVIQQYQLKLIVYQIRQERIVQWIK